MATDIIARGMAAGVVSQVSADRQAVSEDRAAVETAKTEVLNVAESIPEDYSTLSADVSELKEDLENITGSVEQLFDVSKVENGYIESNGSAASTGEYYHTYIPCSPNDVLYTNFIANRLAITYFDSNRALIKHASLIGNKIIVPNDINIAYMSIPIIWYRLYSIIISKNPMPIGANYLLYGQKEYAYNLMSRINFDEILKLESDYDESKYEIIKYDSNVLLKTKTVALDNVYAVNFRLNTVCVDMIINQGFISIAENDEHIIAYQQSVNKIIRLNKNDNKFTYLTDELCQIKLKHKKINVSIYAGIFKVKDYLTGDVYVEYDVSDLIFNYNIISVGAAYFYGMSFYTDVNICLISNTTTFIKETTIEYEQLEKTQWFGKTWYAYGTSLTNTDSEGKYAKYVEQFSGMIRVNKGISGGGICSNTRIKDAVMNTTDGKLNADLITLEVCANDTSATIGTIYDTGNDTFCGALNQCIRYLQENTNAQIVVISSTNSRYNVGDSSDLYVPERTFGTDNHTKFEQWEACRKVCQVNSVPYIPMGESAGLGYARMIASNLYNIDQIHHTEVAGYNLGAFVWEHLKNIPCWKTSI